MPDNELVTVPRHALAELVDYCFAQEEANWCEEGEPATGHVFTHIQALNRALQA